MVRVGRTCSRLAGALARSLAGSIVGDHCRGHVGYRARRWRDDGGDDGDW